MQSTFELNQLGLIQISGPDAATFLQGQLTCDVRDINATHSSLGAYCNIKGRIIATFRIFQWQKDFYLLLPQTMIETMLSKIQKYAVFSKVTLTDVSDQFAVIACYGESVEKTLQQHFDVLPEKINDVTNVVNTNSNIETLWLKIPVNQTIKDTEKMSRYIGIVPVAKKQHLKQILSKVFQEDPVSRWEQLTIQAGIPQIYPATSEIFTPHDVNYPDLGGVSFDKGCYLGQEIVARMHYLGKLKQRMYHGMVKAGSILKPADPIVDDQGKVVGHIVNCGIADGSTSVAASRHATDDSQAAQAAGQTYELLAVVKDQAVAAKTTFVSKTALIRWV